MFHSLNILNSNLAPGEICKGNVREHFRGTQPDGSLYRRRQFKVGVLVQISIRSQVSSIVVVT